MLPDDIFAVVNTIAAAAWLTLIVFPRMRFALRLAGLLVPALLATAYTAVVAMTCRGSAGGFSSLPEVAALFGNPWLLLAGWIHYLAFDLLVGSWQVRDAHERAIPHAYMVLPMVLTFLFGPAGWLSNLVVRAATKPNGPHGRSLYHL